MIELLKKTNRFYETLSLGLLTFLCFSFSVFRLYFSEDPEVIPRLNWNLFLAFIPWFLTSFLMINSKYKKNKIVIGTLLFFWLLFFPNAPYILTDLIHLEGKQSVQLWFDLILILSFAWTGLLFGILSLMDIEKLLNQVMSKKRVNFIIVILLFIGSFGVYLGRFLRWNSWDIISNPFGLISDIGLRIINPFEFAKTWGMTIFMGLFLNMVYWSLKIIQHKNNN
ncbi:DUF1361 domain-containing protein [Lutibacter sp. HS1-25]|uniref:DUF1361 domain-containing protein n=1 Tax=Lutibacter sp. HS1-25 TaxID=2485000 RepID=UPI0010135E07|nr:DUF1361 domain-containing protein [Lutibacter sp. HS1-25]RXP57105.1 DUF1361 domain-containing protein [Lutibacter sp. HS1-25]